ncbi:MAG: RagB/SusD family nutrient uptake outer membrane protein [bacterium]|uniref:Glycan metabolism protein RagB n=1 Tax=Phaeodactylibacter xiamenensis TaxID=1524460 RepID=A0A098S9G6_9BACT|nr:glycan metabolism protein RagB [Phaeodactylibacter xiamenensis]MCR9052083.1 RagB/SusD family nutrient uptake outer membrane protein [bacterium]
MKTIKILFRVTIVLLLSAVILPSCQDIVDEPLQNVQPAEGVDYTRSEDMVLLIQGAYGEFNFLQWETFPLISVRGDDVNAAGDQFPLIETDAFRYDRSFWMYNSAWLNLYGDIINSNGLIEGVNRFKENGADAQLADQYIAEIRVMRAFAYLQAARLWGDLFIFESSDPTTLVDMEIAEFEEVMQHISDQMDLAIPDLPDARPNQRTDIQNGITRYAALALKAYANLELKNWQETVNATDEIISSGLFELYPDFYDAFNIPGKNSNESILELQYSDFGQSSGTNTRYLWNFFGPSSYSPAVEGIGGGWGFWEPNEKFIKFMLDRGEETRLIGSVNFTPDGIASLESDPQYSPLPDFITNVSPDGDIFNNHPRYNFQSAKHYMPSNQYTPGRTTFGENNNFRVIRYAEILLMHAEALVSGASSSVMSADEAVNMVRERAGMPTLTSVDLDAVLDEKYAELAMEWGHRFYDLVRHDRIEELDHEINGEQVSYQRDERYLPYPLLQLDLLPQLKDHNNNE